MSVRTNKASIIVGGRGTGKTTFLKDIVRLSHLPKKLIVELFHNPVWHTMESYNYPQGKYEKIPVVPLDENVLKRWKKGTAFTYSNDEEELFRVIESSVRNAFVLFEDATKYMEGRLTREQKRFVVDCKQKNVDVIFVFHSLGAVPPKLIALCDSITLFKTNDGRLKSAYDPWPELQNKVDYLRNHPNRYENITIELN